jgi:hypothetical protein
MTTPGDDTPDPADDGSAPTAGHVRGLRAVPVLVAIAAVFVVGLVAVRIVQNRAETNPLDPDAPALADFTFHAKGCSYQASRGGLVVHFDVDSSDAGRFTVDVEGVTDEGVDNLDIATTHVVRYTVPFYGGRSRQQFDVVVPLTEADYERGYRKCRYTVNPS